MYVKKAEVVADVVKVLGAPNAVVMFEDARIERHMSSSITKQLAIEEYNRGKTITASKKQIAAIKLLKKNKQYTSMPKNLRNISILRLQHPERSLMDLIVYYAQKHGVEPSKSSVNH
ncbi:MAG: DNA-binding protein WhiA [Tenericutes bacterium]|nr:MAG: DNA-binding protein WhiA [Mycoplasmatota bacterium]